MKHKLLEYLVCPECLSQFKLIVQRADNCEIMEGQLLCTGCPKRYSIHRGVPRILKQNLNKISGMTVKNFGYSWQKVFRFGDADEREFDSYFLKVFAKQYFKDKVILDAGCGSGRFAYFMGKYAAADVIAFDLSGSVDEAFKNTISLKNVHVVQADIYNLPFKKGYDFIYSIGVLHHLSFPEEGFQKLSKLLAGHASILAWVYGKEGNAFYLRFFEPFRKLTCRMPLGINKVGATILAGIIWIIIKIIYLPLGRMGYAERMPMGRYLIFFHGLGFRHFRGTVFDKMIPPISNYYTKAEFSRWFVNNGLRDIKILERNGNSWLGLARSD